MLGVGSGERPASPGRVCEGGDRDEDDAESEPVAECGMGQEHGIRHFIDSESRSRAMKLVAISDRFHT